MHALCTPQIDAFDNVTWMAIFKILNQNAYKLMS